MNDVAKVSTSTEQQTPIEVALQVDENGMTTARKLYAFLELAPRHYAAWSKKNILGDINAKENVDFMRSPSDGNGNPNPTIDYKLSAAFAKKLAMQTKNERGNQARDYFVKVEEALKQTVIAEHESGNIAFMKAFVAELESQRNDIDEIKEDIRILKGQKPAGTIPVIQNDKPSQYVRQGLYTSTAIGKAFGLSALALNKIMCSEGIIQKTYVQKASSSEKIQHWIVTDKYRGFKYTAQKFYGVNNIQNNKPVEITYAWTPKGVAFVVELLKRKGYTQYGIISNRTTARVKKAAH